MQRLVIDTETEDKKSRCFGGTCLGMFFANFLYEEGYSGKNLRPIWALFAGTDTELKPFMANLRCGRKASIPNKKGSNSIEFLKGGKFNVSWLRYEEGSLATIYHPELFRLDPGIVDPLMVKFVLVVPEDWAYAQTGLDPSAVDHVLNVKKAEEWSLPLTQEELDQLLPTAYLFAAYLDRRTSIPLLTDAKFYLQLLCAALEEGLASFSYEGTNYNTWGVSKKIGFQFTSSPDSYSWDTTDLRAINIRTAIAFAASQVAFEEFIKRQVTLFFNVTDKSEESDFRPLLEALGKLPF